MEGAVEAAKIAGFEVTMVYPSTFDPAIFQDAAVWIHPGGKATTGAKAMGRTMMGHIRTFIGNGGGYVGFCAGAFLTTSRIGASWTKGLGIIPGRTVLYKAKGYPTVEKMDWGGKLREIYWEGGPYFSYGVNEGRNMTVLGRYNRTNQVSAVQTSYGKGRVSVTGAHPEAPKWWRDSSNLTDNDGLDYDLTTEMIVWAARKI